MKPEPNCNSNDYKKSGYNFSTKWGNKSTHGEELIDFVEEKKLQERDKLADLIADALAEFAPSIYSRSIRREDIENWLEKKEV